MKNGFSFGAVAASLVAPREAVLGVPTGTSFVSFGL